MSAGVEDHPIDQAVAQLVVEPVQVLDVGRSNGIGEFDLDRERGTVGRLDDQVDFVVGVLCAKVPDPGIGRFGVNPHRLGGQRLEERPQPGAGRSVDATALAAQEPGLADADETGGQGRVDQMVLGGVREPLQLPERRRPRLDINPFEC